MTIQQCSHLTLLSSIMSTCIAGIARGEVQYTVLDLGQLNRSGWVTDINNKGQAVGMDYFSLNGDTTNHAFRTAPNSPINWSTDDLDSLNAPSKGPASAIAINELGQVVGISGKVNGHGSSPFRTAPNSRINPATDDLGGSYGTGEDINDSGQAVGYTDIPSRAFRASPNGKFGDPGSYLGTLGGESAAVGINNSGQAVGRSTLRNGRTHAFRTGPNALINPATDDLGTLSGNYSEANRINDKGQVVGFATISGDAASHAFLTSATGQISDAGADLGTLGGLNSQGYDVNEAGVAVGTSQVANDAAFHAFVYTPGGNMLDLNSLIDSSYGWMLQQAYAVNDLGQIVGNGLLQGQNHGFLLTPVTEPGMLGVFAIGIGLVVRHRRSPAPAS